MIGGPYFEVHDWWTPIIIIIFVTWSFVAGVAHSLPRRYSQYCGAIVFVSSWSVRF